MWASFFAAIFPAERTRFYDDKRGSGSIPAAVDKKEKKDDDHRLYLYGTGTPVSFLVHDMAVAEYGVLWIVQVESGWCEKIYRIAELQISVHRRSQLQEGVGKYDHLYNAEYGIYAYNLYGLRSYSSK